MTEKFPPHREFFFHEKHLNEHSDLLDELTRIRKDIEQESMPLCHLQGLAQKRSPTQDRYNHSDSENDTNTTDKSLQSETFRQFHRFDFEHRNREDTGYFEIDSKSDVLFEQKSKDSDPPLRGKDFVYKPTLQPETKISQPSKPAEIEDGQKHYRYDDAPVVIPIRNPESPDFVRNPKQGIAAQHNKKRDSYQNYQTDSDDTGVSPLPWEMISQYENENFVVLTANASYLSLLIGWCAIACGVVIFLRSLFASSTIWLNYGLPILALGAVCLFLGIILSILSEKMQHINELKQSLAARRINNPSNRKFDPPHNMYASNNASTYVNQNDTDELESVYDRLVQLRSEVNELIDECENS